MTSTTSQLPARLSPLHEALAHHRPTWGAIADMPVALSFAPAAQERERAQRLGLCDASALRRMTLKGPGAKALLDAQGIAAPDAVFAVAPLVNAGLVARTGGAEFFIEDGPSDAAVARIEQAMLANPAGVYPVRRADAAILISGSLALEVLAQTCGYNFNDPSPPSSAGIQHQLVFTRVAGVSCSILSRTINGITLFQLWCDGTYGMSLWETLLEITGELNGGLIGLSCFFPDISQTPPAA